MDKQAQPIVILHIPKTAGTSLRKFVLENYEPEELFFIYSKDSHFTTQEDFKALTQEQKKNYKVFMGHIGFNPVQFKGLQPTYVSMVRDPVERILSYYHHIMNEREEWRGRNISLLKYLDTVGDSQLDNHQTRLLSGMHKRPVTDEHLQKAKQNIKKHFSHIGTTENFDDSVNELCRLFGWSKKEVPRKNVSEGRRKSDYYSDYEINQIRKLNQFDQKLYRFVERLREEET
ncbi:MAG: sulfotransferase family 2 domain-containing protein [Gammaproteobacteria bacterium]